ncbi:unnamed protein product [Schistosoma rodhaini]|nr:unnamed protein product [Schistosoma rodhaini]
MSINGKSNQKSILLILFYRFIIKLDYHYYYYYYYYYIIIILSWLLSLTMCKELMYNEQYYNIKNYIKGPENQTILYNSNTIMYCRIYNNNNITKLKSFYTEYINVQWIIDGFGVNNESLKAVFGDRYSMPGPIEEGNFDLLIKNTQLEDEASFICQANVKIYSTSSIEPQLDTITSKPAYLTIIFPPSGLTMIHLQDSQLEKNHQTPVTVNSMYILPNNHFTNYISDHSVNRHVYTTNELNQIVDRDLSRIVADDPKTELFIDYNRNYMDHFKQASDTQYTSHNIPLKEMLVRHESSSYTGNMYNRIPKIWTVEKKKLIVSCHTSPSKPASTIQWHLAGILLTKNSDKSHSFSDHQNSLIHYTIKEQIINVSDKSILSSNAESVLFPNTSVTSSTDDVHMQVTQSQLNLTVERKYQHWQLECSVSNSNDFVLAKLPTVTVTIEPMYIEDVKIQIINQTEQVNLREGQLIHFECIAKTSPLTPIYSWTIGNPVPSVNFETFNLLTDDQLKSNNNIDDKHEHNLIDIQMNASILQLTVNRAMHHKRIRCWVGVEAPELLEKITNASLQGVLSNKDSTCESDCRQLRNSLRKKLKDMTWVKSDYRLEVTYGPEFSSPSNDILSGELGQIIHLECSANSNPEADVSLYYIGPEGQILLEEVTKSELTQYQHHYNRPVDSKHPKYLVWNSETEYAEFNISIVKAAIHSSGRKLLGSDIKQVSHKLHLTSHEQFGFYACIAQTTGYPSIYRTVYVGQAESPKILKIDQSISLDGTFAELFCTIYSIPRPTVHQITWSINGISIKPDKRLRIYQEKTHRGVTSILTLNNLRPNDFSTYNCTVVNDYGSDWKLITLSSDNKWPLTFAVISGFAALLGVLFVTIICCFIRYTRLKGTNSKVYYKSKQENNLQNNEENKQISDGVELQSILKNKLNQTGLSKANPIEDVTLTNNECYPVQNVYKSNVDDTGIGKCTSHDLGSINFHTNDIDLSTNLIEENYLNYISCTYPQDTTSLLNNIHPMNGNACTNKMSTNYNQLPYCSTPLIDHQFNTIISNISPLSTSECFTNDMISNIKQSDITSIIHSHSPKPWIQNINELKNSMTPPLAFSSYTNHSTSLAPIFLMTSDLNYSTGIHQDFNNSNTSTVIIPPVILHSTNEQTLISSPYGPMTINNNNSSNNTNTSIIFNTTNNNDRNHIPDISIIPFNVRNC